VSKFKTRPRVVEAHRITDESLAGADGIGSWLVLDDKKQRVVDNAAFLKEYTPAGRGASKNAYEIAKKDAGIVDPPPKQPAPKKSKAEAKAEA